MTNLPERAAHRRRPGPARSLTREQVVDTALEIMSAKGLDAVSFRTIAVRLGLDPKALYTYVADKDDLRRAMFDRQLRDLDMPLPGDVRAPTERLVNLLTSMRRLMLRNPDTFRLLRPTDDTNQLAAHWEEVLGTVYALDPDTASAMRIWARLVHYTVGNALFSAQVLPQIAPYDELAGNVDPAAYPNVTRALRHPPAVEDEATFAATIRVMIQQRIGEA